MKFDNIQVYNFEGAFRGMRNPMNSWMKSDSCFGLRSFREGDAELEDLAKDWTAIDGCNPTDEGYDEHRFQREDWLSNNGILKLNPIQQIAIIAYIGPEDMKLAQRLIAAGPEHRKFLRQIFVSVDITAPLYWYKEFDTYKIGTVANSTSTMHKLTSAPITLKCFEIDDYDDKILNTIDNPLISIEGIIEYLEQIRQKYLETKDKKYWKELVRWLPESWLQTRTVTMNYENLLSIYHQRKDHKLNEWSGKDNPFNENFISFIEQLPYAHELILYKGE